MTKEEIKAKSKEKVEAVTTLCKQLKLVVTAEQMITEKGFIKLVVYYTDTENYDVDKEPVNDKEDAGLPSKEENAEALDALASGETATQPPDLRQ